MYVEQTASLHIIQGYNAPTPNYTSCLMQSGQQWRPVGGCFGGSGTNQVCSDRGQMSPLSNSRFGTLDDDFARVTWIYADYGRVVVNPTKPRGQYIPAMPYLQNGFALLQIAIQEARDDHRTFFRLLYFKLLLILCRLQNIFRASHLSHLAPSHHSLRRKYSRTPPLTCRGSWPVPTF